MSPKSGASSASLVLKRLLGEKFIDLVGWLRASFILVAIRYSADVQLHALLMQLLPA